MAVALAEVLAAAGCEPVRLVGKADGPWRQVDGRPLQVVVEDREDTHALTGIAAALSACATQTCVVVATDLPFLTPEAVRAVAGVPPPAIAFADDFRLVLHLHRDQSAGALAMRDAGMSVRNFVEGATRVPVDSALVDDLDERPGVDPLEAWLRRLPPLSVAAIEAERCRLLARGVRWRLGDGQRGA